MDGALLLPGLLPGMLLIIIGLAIKYGKAYWLISGYNTMSAEKKKNVDTEGLGRFIANVCFAMAAIFLAAFLLMYWTKMAFAGMTLLFILPVIIYALIKAQKYDGNTRNAEGKMKTSTKIIIGSVIGILVLVAIGVGVLLHFSSKPAEYTVQNGIFKISGMYGQNIPVDEIKNLEIKETIPKVITKTNGSALANMYKGYFTLNKIGKAKLFVDVSKAPFIYLEYNGETIILNCEERKKTEELFQRLKDAWGK